MHNEIKIDPTFWRDDLDDREVIVSIRCLTYNHEPYIRDALEGFVNQKTNFRFEAIVHDDASTDGTADIIREYAEKYPSIIKPIIETENQYSKNDGSLKRIMDAHMRGKYIAFCEGDDYWTDPLKLQKQVDFLETHNEYGMSFAKVKYFFDKKKKYGLIFGRAITTPQELILHNTIPTLSVVIRKNIYLEFINLMSQIRNLNWKMGDFPMWLYFAIHSKINFLDESIGVYRILEESACHSKSFEKKLDFIKSFYDIQCFFNKKYNIIGQTIIDDTYHRALLSASLGYNVRNYALNEYRRIKNKDVKDKIKYLLCKYNLSKIYQISLKLKGCK